MIGIIGAMDVEVNALKAQVNNATKRTLSGVEFVTGDINGCAVTVAQCDPGKVNAALCTQKMLDTFAPDAIINVGVGCSLSEEVVIGDIVVADKVCQYDIDITALGEPRGLINGLNRIYLPADESLCAALCAAAKAEGAQVHTGTVTSGDTFLGDSVQKAALHREFGALCGEMEGGAIGQVCTLAGVPFAVLRCISDGGDESVQLDYPVFKKIAAERSTAMLLRYFASLTA